MEERVFRNHVVMSDSLLADLLLSEFNLNAIPLDSRYLCIMLTALQTYPKQDSSGRERRD